MSVLAVANSQSLAELLSDGLFVDGDWVETKDQDPSGDVRLIQLADVGDGTFRDRSSRFLTMAKAKELGCTFLQPGDVLVARMPEPLGRACVFPSVGMPAVTAVDVCILRPNPERVSANWLVKAINSPDFRDDMQQFVRGTTRQRISRRNLGTLKMLVPPRPDQDRISRLVDRLLSDQSAAASHAVSGRRAIERLRQAILTAALSGLLTTDWRDSHDVTTSAQDLVQAIEAGRRSRHKEHPVKLPDDSLPASWCWTTVGLLVDVATGATPLRRRADYYGGTIPWVTSGAVNAGLIQEATDHITELAIRETNAKIFPVGTLLVAMYGEGQTRGRVGELAISAATNQAVAALLFDDATDSLRPYLKLFFLENYERIRTLSFGGVQPNLSLGAIRDTVLPLPPKDEQNEIVRRVDQLLEIADSLKRRIETAERCIARSSQAILAKAFRGELTASADVEIG